MPSITNSGAINELDPEHVPDRSGDVDESDLTKEESSAGTSSSTSGRKPGRNGSSGTPGLHWLAPGAESPSDRGRPASTPPSSSASSTGGSIRETGPSPAHQPGSSAESAQVTPATPAPDPSSPEVGDTEAHASEAGETATAADDPRAALSEAERETEARSLVASAHQAYQDKDYALAEGLLDQAEEILPEIRSETAQARQAVADRQAEGK